jgi:hypothetical protein
VTPRFGAGQSAKSRTFALWIRRVDCFRPRNVWRREIHSCMPYLSRSKTHSVGAAYIRSKKTLHLVTSSLLSGSGLGGNAIGGDDDLVASHIGVIGREENAKCPRQTL